MLWSWNRAGWLGSSWSSGVVQASESGFTGAFMALSPPDVLSGLVLRLRQADHQTVQGVGHGDLAGEPGIGLGRRGEAQHARLLLARRAGLRQPGLVHIDMAGGAGAFAAAIGIDAGHAVVDRAAHDGEAFLQLDAVLGPVVLDIGHLWHGRSSCFGAG